VARCRGAGLALNTWTCDEPGWIRDLAAWGVDGICTNVPDLARAVLAGQ
jgi:glycerophosphoryl diester phosphodiesterase